VAMRAGAAPGSGCLPRNAPLSLSLPDASLSCGSATREALGGGGGGLLSGRVPLGAGAADDRGQTIAPPPAIDERRPARDGSDAPHRAPTCSACRSSRCRSRNEPREAGGAPALADQEVAGGRGVPPMRMEALLLKVLSSCMLPARASVPAPLRRIFWRQSRPAHERSVGSFPTLKEPTQRLAEKRTSRRGAGRSLAAPRLVFFSLSRTHERKTNHGDAGPAPHR
jgi:hypothetical protein